MRRDAGRRRRRAPLPRRGVALAEVRAATTVDAIVAAFAVQRTGIVYTGDVVDFEALRGFFPALRVFAV